MNRYHIFLLGMGHLKQKNAVFTKNTPARKIKTCLFKNLRHEKKSRSVRKLDGKKIILYRQVDEPGGPHNSDYQGSYGGRC